MLRSNGTLFKAMVQRDEIVSAEISLPAIQCIPGANAKEHEKPECSCLMTKQLGSFLPKSNKEKI